MENEISGRIRYEHNLILDLKTKRLSIYFVLGIKKRSGYFLGQKVEQK